MSRIYTQEDYEGVVDDQYRRYPFFATRADIVDALFPEHRNEIVVVAGGGWGYLLDELDARQWNRVYSLDASAYAVNKGGQEMPTKASRILQGDILNDQDLRNFRRDVGRPVFVITEDILPCAADVAEAQLMLDNLRGFRRPSGAMMHFITPRDELGVLQADGSVVWPWGEEVQMPGFLWLTEQEWLDLIGPDEPVVFTNAYPEV